MAKRRNKQDLIAEDMRQNVESLLTNMLKGDKVFKMAPQPGMTGVFVFDIPIQDNIPFADGAGCTVDARLRVYTIAHQRRLYQHIQTLMQLHDIFDRKNRDYGDSFARCGLPGILVRLEDKIHRAMVLSDTGYTISVQDEKLEDTLLDMANYAIMGLMLLREGRK